MEVFRLLHISWRKAKTIPKAAHTYFMGWIFRKKTDVDLVAE
jgi:hypothetical protein